jgi:acyl-CoA synthetase (AMP-forming)/AMP-acid ligase II
MTDIATQEPEMPAQEPIHLDPALTVPFWLRNVCERYGERPALVFGDEAWTYRRLGEEVSKLEATLLGLGVTKGTRVALVMGMRPEWVVSAFAAMSVGAVAVPLSTYEPPDKRELLLRHADASIVILKDQMLRHTYLDDLVREHPWLQEAGPQPYFDAALPYLRHVIHVGGGESRGRLLAWNDAVENAPQLPDKYLESIERELHPTDEALIIYTSGTSGTPKGVVHAHRTAAVQFERLPREFTITSEDVVWGTYPLFWSAGIGWILGPTLSIGAKLVLQELFDPVGALDLIEKHRVTVAHITPTHAGELEDALKHHPADVSSIRIIPRDSLAGHLNLPADAPFGGASLGLTETLTLAASIPWDSSVELRRQTHGQPLPGLSMKIIDPETGETLPTGEHGEIAIKGTTLMKGYNKAFPETYLDQCGYYRTKDSGYFDQDGYLHWTGRMSQVIRTNNALVSPAEVEAALHAHPGIKTAAVIGVPDETYGELVVACVVPASDTALNEEGVRAELKDRLAGYKIPTRIFFVEESELPMTATGKPVLDSLSGLVAARMQSTEPEGDAQL